MDVFLLRHAETEANRDGSLATGSDDALTRYGNWQARAIIERLTSLEVEGILCSPYSRALDTIRPFAEAVNLEIRVHPCLAEGQLSLSDTVVLEEPNYTRHVSGYDCPQVSESAGSFLSRVKHTHELIVSQPFSKVLVVTHGHMIRELLNSMLALPVKTRFPHENCGLSHISLGSVNAIKFINRPMCSSQ